jgi:hypothetical protein
MDERDVAVGRSEYLAADFHPHFCRSFLFSFFGIFKNLNLLIFSWVSILLGLYKETKKLSYDESKMGRILFF